MQARLVRAYLFSARFGSILLKMENNAPYLFLNQHFLPAWSDLVFSPPSAPCRAVTFISDASFLKSTFSHQSQNMIAGLSKHRRWETDRIVSPCLTVIEEAVNLTASCATTVWVCGKRLTHRWGKTLMKCPSCKEQLNPSARSTTSQHCPVYVAVEKWHVEILLQLRIFTR